MSVFFPFSGVSFISGNFTKILKCYDPLYRIFFVMPVVHDKHVENPFEVLRKERFSQKNERQERFEMEQKEVLENYFFVLLQKDVAEYDFFPQRFFLFFSKQLPKNEKHHHVRGVLEKQNEKNAFVFLFEKEFQSLSLNDIASEAFAKN